MTTVYSYFRISDAQKQLAALYEKHGQDAIFLVPTTLDKDSLTDIITGGKSVFGKRPQIMTLSELYNELAQQEQDTRHVIDPPDHKLILKYIVGEYLAACDAEQLPAGVKHKGFISLLSDNIHTLIRECVTPELLEEKVVYALPPYAPESILHNLYSAYLAYLERNRLIDSIQTPDRLWELIKKGGKAKAFMDRHTLAVVGFSSFTGNQLKLFKQLEDLFSLVYFLPRTGMVGKFRGAIEQLGFLIDNEHRIPTKKLAVRQLTANGQNLEFAAITREIALQATDKGTLFCGLDNAQFDFGQIGILASAQTLDYVENELKRYRLPYFVSLRGTVGETPLGKLPKLIWAAKASKWDTQETAILLSDPLLSPNGFPQRSFIEKFVRSDEGWRKALAKFAPEKSAQFESILALCKKLSTKQSPIDILSAWAEFLSKLAIAQNAAILADAMPEYDFAVKNLAFALKEIDKKIRVLKDHARNIGDAQDVKYAGAEAIEYLLDWAETATLPIQLPQKNAIALYGATPPTFTQHDFWIMTDADGNSWPGKFKESPLLRKEQLELINQKEEEEIDFRTAHIPTLRDQREQREMLFRRLLATARVASITAASSTDANGRPVPENTLIADLTDGDKNNLGEAPWTVITPPVKYALIDAMPKTLEQSFCGAEISEDTPQNSRGTLPREVFYQQENPSISLSALDVWTECPYHYWCRLMRLEEWKSDSFNHILAGNLTHKIWELYWKQDKEKLGSFTEFVNEIWESEAVQSEYLALSSDRLARHRELLKNQVQNVALLLDCIEPKAKAAGRINVMAELNLKYPDGNDFEIDGVKIRGKVDRIDLYPNNKAVILDFKLNKSESHKEELQLAAYGYLLQKLRGYDIAGYGWIGHKDGKLCGYFTEEMKQIYASVNTSKIAGEDKLRDKLGNAEETLKKMATAVKQGEFKATPDKKKAGSSTSVCHYCEFAAICRKREAPGYIEESEEQD